MLSIVNHSFMLLLLVLLGLSSTVVAYPIAVDWKIAIPNATYPAIGELAKGTLYYDSEPNPNIVAIGWPEGNPILSITGTRSVWSSTAAEPTTYHLNSTANILGLVPASHNEYVYYNATLDTVLPNPDGLCGSIAFGTLLIYDKLNLPANEYNPGAGLFPNYFLIYDNYYYPQSTVPDHMDAGGWTVLLDRPQPPTELDISQYNGREFEVYKHVWNIYNAGGAPTDSGDLSDAFSLPYNPIIYTGSGGTITVSSVKSCIRRRLVGGCSFHQCED